MLKNNSKLNLVRIGSDITYSSLKEIGSGILTSFHGIINEIYLAHYESPIIDSIDAQLLTLILGEEYVGNTLGITDADLKIDDGDEFYNSILGGKNPQNDVAVVSTKKLAPANMFSEAEIDLFVDRTTKVALHEVGDLLNELGPQPFVHVHPPAGGVAPSVAQARRRSTSSIARRRRSTARWCGSA